VSIVSYCAIVNTHAKQKGGGSGINKADKETEAEQCGWLCENFQSKKNTITQSDNKMTQRKSRGRV
jgi:hypothetical protein